jgi:hypothetical protein
MKLVFLFIFISSSFGQVLEDQFKRDDRAGYKIDRKYYGGEYLIYNCEVSNFACVDLPSFQKCTDERKLALENKRAVLPCAPLKKFKDKISCVQKNYELVHLNAVKGFCLPK